MSKSKDCAKSAVWESDTKLLFVDLCVKEVEAGNRPTTFLNKEGWQNVASNFKERTGRVYTKLQLKNKWDQIKKDWKCWKELTFGCTGLGWDPIKKTIDASETWWKEKLEVIPNARKFRYGGIEPDLEAKLDIMFRGVVSTGSNAWTACASGPSDFQDRDDLEETEHSNDLDEDVTPLTGGATQSSGTKRARSTTPMLPPSKKGTSAVMRDQISGLLNVATTLTIGEKSDVPTLSDCIAILYKMPEVFNDDALFLHAARVLKDQANRETFIAMTYAHRLKFLRAELIDSSHQPSSSLG